MQNLGNSTGHRTVTMAAPLLLTSGPGRYEAVLHSCGTSPVEVATHWDIRPPAPLPAISLIILTQQTSPCPILIMPSTGLGGDKYQF